jgi:alkaline phosphatase D
METKVALTSCVKVQNQKVQPVWDEIEKFDPDVLVLAGDNVYGHQSKTNEKAEAYMIDKYERQYKTEVPNFTKLLAKLNAGGRQDVVSTWDDHDFGPNNSKGSKVSDHWKDFVKRMFTKYNYWSADRIRQKEGIYHSVVLHGIKFISLDVRTFRNKSHKISLWKLNLFKRKDATILGDNQKAWFEKEIKHGGPVAIVSGSTFSNGKDGWKNYKADRKWLLDLCYDHGNVTLLSGDVHTNRVLQYQREGNDRIMYEITSSASGRDNKNNWGELVFNQAGLLRYTFHGKDKGSLKKVKL